MRPQMRRAVCPSKDTSTSPLLTPPSNTTSQTGWCFCRVFLHTITRLSHYCAHCEPAVIPRENRAPMENRPSLVFSGKCQSGCKVMGCERRGLTCGCGAFMPSPCSRSRQKNMQEKPAGGPFVGFRERERWSKSTWTSTMVLCTSLGFLVFPLGVW